jgi:hypothetical protein
MNLVVIAILSAHLLLVDLAMAGPLLALWFDCKTYKGLGSQAAALAASLIRWSTVSLAAALVLGFGLLGIFWHSSAHDDYFTALQLIPASRLWLGLAELAFYFLCLALYRFWLIRSASRFRWRWFFRALPVMAATDLMFHFPPLFAVVSVLASRPLERSLLIDGLSRRDYYSLLFDAEVLARVIHVWLAAIAVAGSAAILLALRNEAADQRAAANTIATSAARWAGVATLLQIPVGLWLTYSLSDGARDSVLGGDVFATAMFAAAVLCSLPLLHLLASASLGDVDIVRARRIAVIMSLVVVLMVGTLHRATRVSVARRTSPAVDSATIFTSDIFKETAHP